MRICIHRGTQEIGGTCIEIEAQGRRIVLDLGLPLDAPDREAHEDLLPQVPGFTEPDDSLLGLLISHPHRDHYGLAPRVRPELPVYIGEDAHGIMKAASAYVPGGHSFADPRFFRNRIPVEIGPFRVTPYLVDHSAFDAYALLVEADGKRVCYSGDFRGHGRKAALFESMVRNPPGNIDILLMEGTTIGRTGSEEGFATEDDLENEFLRAFEQTRGIHFVWTSSQNIDRPSISTPRSCSKRRVETASHSPIGAKSGSILRIASGCSSRRRNCSPTSSDTARTASSRKTCPA